MNYLVMEVHKAYCVVMDNGGKLYKVANLHYQLGQTVDNVIIMEDVKTKAKFRWANYFNFPTLAAATSLAFICILGFFSFFNQPFEAYAQVYLTVNPQVKISVDKQNKVGGIEALNADGAKLIFDYDYKNKALTMVLDQLLDRALEYDMLKEDGQVSIDIDTNDQTWFQDTGIVLRDNLNQYLQDKVTVTIKIQNYTNIEDDDQEIEDDVDELDDDISNNQDDDDLNDDDIVPTNKVLLSSDQVLSIAYNHAGLNFSQVNLIKNELDCDDDQMDDCKYEIEFEANQSKYNYEIDALNGVIIHHDVEIED